MFLKPIRETSKEYLDFIRRRRCMICFKDAEPHHLRSVGSGGSDFTAVPLCRVHHTEWHQMGDKKFIETHGVNPWKEAFYLLLRWHNGNPS